MLLFDAATRTLRHRGLPRFVAVAALCGAMWLAVAGFQLVAVELPPAGPRYDAVIHGVFIGFLLSMVMAHAPLVLRTSVNVHLPFHAGLYGPLVLLHASLAARVTADWWGLVEVRRLAALVNAGSLVLFVVTLVIAGRSHRLGMASRGDVEGRDVP
jgi:hypothetical protein